MSFLLPLQNKIMSIVAIAYWAIWFMRNKLVHEGRRISITKIVGFIQGYFKECACISGSTMLRPIGVSKFWRPLEHPFIKINFDASFYNNNRQTHIGTVARDRQGQVMQSCVYLPRNVANTFVAEAKACEVVVRFALDMGFRFV